MHNAPPVTYPLGRSHFQGVAVLGLWLAGAGVLALWWRAAPAADWRLWTALAAVLAAGVAAGWAWLHSPVGQLRWDGKDWRWESQGYQSGTPVRDLTVALDLQRTMLLRLENQDHATLWLWAGHSTQPERWLDLRRAVYSQHRPSPDLVPWDASPPVAMSDFPAQLPLPRSGS
ncbi:MAG: hypothetical protein PSV40_04950 [Polaromonas sp.]|uniref:hypothetical protein n=1 Tax=Polaromonas sp. TaxID=1869339 RepID=UPI0024872814|nr:hypothetical protein [Polaromonas sp.]MDI1268435.1 hypothetical protein [Polaromonas sp.]